MANDKKQEASSFDFFDILRSAKEHIAAILIITILITSAAYVKMIWFTNDTYTSSGMLCISNRTASLGGEAVNSGDVYTARTLGPTYQKILQTISFYDDVKNYITLNYADDSSLSEAERECCNRIKTYPSSALKSVTTITLVESTELVTVSVTTRDALEAYIICDAVLKSSSKKLKDIYKAGEVSIVDQATRAGRNAKGTVRYVAIAAVIGVIIGFAYAYLRFAFDKRIKSPEAVVKRYGISILGELSD